MKTIYINLVSEQLIPNLIPTLQDNNCIGVVLVLGDVRFQQKADLLRKIYQRNGIDVLGDYQGDSSTRLMSLQSLAHSLLDDLQARYNDTDIRWILNATCGTKPMSLAFTNAFNQFNLQHADDGTGPKALVLYTDTEHKEIPLLNQDTDFALPFTDVLTLDDSLLANGFELESATDSDNDTQVQHRKALTLYLLRQFAESCKPLMGILQYAAHQARQNFPLADTQLLNTTPKGPWADLIGRVQDAGLVQWDGEKQLCFTSEEACVYLSGGWLEEATYLIAQKVGFRYVALGVTGQWRQDLAGYNLSSEVSNELDVLVLHNNRLLVVECKAINWNAQESQKNQGIVHKLENLGRKLGGQFASSTLISAQDLTDSVRQRLESSNIKYVEAPCTEAAIERMFNNWKTMVS